MQKLVMITRYFPPTINGLSAHSHFLLEILSSQFSNITVICEQHPSGDRENQLRRLENVHLVTFSSTSELQSIALKLIKEESPDVVLLQYVPHMWGRAGVAPQIVLLLAKVSLNFGVPVITFVHEMFYDWSWSPKRTVFSLIHRAQLFVIGSLSRVLIVTNEYRRRQLSKYWPSKVCRIPAGNVSARKDEHLRVNLFSWPYIVWFGTLSEGQRLEQLVSAFCLVGTELDKLRLVLVGAFDVENSKINALRRVCQENGFAERLIVHGYASDDQISDILSNSIACIHVNKSGPSGRRSVVAAYARSGRPMICIDGNETDPEFQDKDNVLLVQDGDITGLMEAILLVCQDKDLQAVLARGARELFVEQWSDNAISHKMTSTVFMHLNQVAR